MSDPETPIRRHAPTPLRLTDSEELAALAPGWSALHAATPGATPFTHPAWHEAWLRHFGAGTAPVFLAVRIADELAGVAALDLQRDRARSLGDASVRDYGGPLAAPGHEAQVARGVLEWLAEDLTPALELRGLPADSPIAAAFEDAAGDLGWACAREPEAVCPVLALPRGFEAFVASLHKHERHELRRKLRHLEAAGAAVYASTGDPIEVAAAMDAFLAMMRASRGDKDAFLTLTMEAFFRDLAASFATLGMARMGTLALQDRPIAMLLAFESPGTTFLYNSGYDPDWAALAPGLLSKVYAIREAIERGQGRFDFLRGDEDYKRRLGGVPRELLTLRLRQR
ncbi:MAG: GNAT family N-acetyltransferase [Chloroflexi bacterium]|nr:GNAT family N-acetyltransferase [Chloroflexota bacterium]